MTGFYIGFTLVLVLSLAGGLVRIVRGPTRLDRLLAAQLLGTTGVAMLLVMGEALDRPGLRDVAVLFALLAAFNVLAFVRRSAVAAESDRVQR